ncbi:MAG: STAS domain-containing protein [Acidobacteriota bacterium]
MFPSLTTSLWSGTLLRVSVGLSINIRESQGVTVLELSGKLIFGKECDTLREQLQPLLATDKKRIVLKLEKVSYCDSAGLGCLTSAFTSIRNQGGELKLVSPSKQVQEALHITRLDAILAVYASEDEALSSFK